MQIVILLTIIFVVGVFCDDSTYTDKYDNIDVEAIMKNDRLLKNYVDCLLDRGKCTSDAAELKKRIPEALETACAKCSEKHKSGLRMVVKYLVENKKDMWNELVLKYDPNREYIERYADLLKEENINI